MSRRIVPVLTPEQYRTQSLALRVEVAEIAWSLVVSPSPLTELRRWRALSADETLDVFERLFGAIGRHAVTDQARIAGDPAAPR